MISWKFIIDTTTTDDLPCNVGKLRRSSPPDDSMSHVLTTSYSAVSMCGCMRPWQIIFDMLNNL